jgi:hypothetical protein
MSGYKKSVKKDEDGFTELPIKLTERERAIILALRVSSLKDETPRETSTAAPRSGGSFRGGRGGARTTGPGRPYVSAEKPAGGAGDATPARKTYASATRGKDAVKTEKTEETKKFVRTEVSEETQKRVNDAFESIDLSAAKNFTQLSKVKVDDTPIYYFKKHIDSSESFKCMAGEVHGSAISKFVKELDAPAFVIIRALMLKLYAWLKTNNTTVLEEIRSNTQWSNCFREDILESAEVVFMKDRTKVLLGKTASAKPFDDSDAE